MGFDKPTPGGLIRQARNSIRDKKSQLGNGIYVVTLSLLSYFKKETCE